MPRRRIGWIHTNDPAPTTAAFGDAMGKLGYTGTIALAIGLRIARKADALRQATGEPSRMFVALLVTQAAASPVVHRPCGRRP